MRIKLFCNECKRISFMEIVAFEKYQCQFNNCGSYEVNEYSSNDVIMLSRNSRKLIGIYIDIFNPRIKSIYGKVDEFIDNNYERLATDETIDDSIISFTIYDKECFHARIGNKDKYILKFVQENKKIIIIIPYISKGYFFAENNIYPSDIVIYYIYKAFKKNFSESYLHEIAFTSVIESGYKEAYNTICEDSIKKSNYFYKRFDKEKYSSRGIFYQSGFHDEKFDSKYFRQKGNKNFLNIIFTKLVKRIIHIFNSSNDIIAIETNNVKDPTYILHEGTVLSINDSKKILRGEQVYSNYEEYKSSFHKSILNFKEITSKWVSTDSYKNQEKSHLINSLKYKADDLRNYLILFKKLKLELLENHNKISDDKKHIIENKCPSLRHLCLVACFREKSGIWHLGKDTNSGNILSKLLNNKDYYYMKKKFFNKNTKISFNNLQAFALNTSNIGIINNVFHHSLWQQHSDTLLEHYNKVSLEYNL